MLRLGCLDPLATAPTANRPHRRGENVDTMVHMRLLRADWLANEWGQNVTITEFEVYRPLFGLIDDLHQPKCHR